jgi:hypothetical protein
MKPSQVFIRSNSSVSAGAQVQQNSTHFVDDMDTSGLIDYVDYGYDANSFLLSSGVLHHPPPEILAELLLDRQATYFANLKDDNKDLLPIKLRVYTSCLQQLASFSTWSRRLHVEPLRSRLIKERWCLGYQTILGPNNSTYQNFKISKPNEIYLNDDEQSAIDLKPLCAPAEPGLTKLYAQFGSKWLSECIKRYLVHKGMDICNFALLTVVGLVLLLLYMQISDSFLTMEGRQVISRFQVRGMCIE